MEQNVDAFAIPNPANVDFVDSRLMKYFNVSGSECIFSSPRCSK